MITHDLAQISFRYDRDQSGSQTRAGFSVTYEEKTEQVFSLRRKFCSVKVCQKKLRYCAVADASMASMISCSFTASAKVGAVWVPWVMSSYIRA